MDTLKTAFTLRNASKFVVKCTIHGYAASFAENAITDHTSFEEDDLTVKISSNLVGWFVSDRLSPHTNRMVDKTADWLVARKENRNAKKAQKDATE